MTNRTEQLRHSRELNRACQNLTTYLASYAVRGRAKDSLWFVGGRTINQTVSLDIDRLVVGLRPEQRLRFTTSGLDPVPKFVPLDSPTAGEDNTPRVSEGALIISPPPLPPMSSLDINHYLIAGDDLPTLGTTFLGDRMREEYVRLDHMALAIGNRATLRIVTT